MFFKTWRRNRAAQRPFPSEWFGILNRNVPYYRALPADDQLELRRYILIFLAEKYFEGVKGLVITDEVRVTIAAQACILLLHRKTDYYPGLRSIVVYPKAFVVPEARHYASNLVIEGPEERLGEAWHRGPVVLSWEDVLYDTEEPHDGQNVVLHEFAHQIDSTMGQGDDSPVLAHRNEFLAWSRVLNEEYQKLVQDVEDGRPTFLDDYGATNPAEFFAVVTECFFEQPAELEYQHPDLYNAMRDLYQQDPARLPK